MRSLRSFYGHIPAREVHPLRMWFRRVFRLYLSEDEIVQDLYRQLDEEGRKEWGKLTQSDLHFMHFTLGMSIRNNYGLWETGNPHVTLDAPPNAEGVLDHPDHPDQMSFRIMEKLQAKCCELKVVK